jgi:hypothetical protein
MKRRLERLLTVAALGFGVWFIHWTVDINNGFQNWGDMDYFRLLVRGWMKGQLHLDIAPNPELLELSDPYDPTQNEGLKLGDATLYRGRYYVYFGSAPAFTLMLPYALLTGRELTMGAAVFVFASVAFLTASLLWLAIRRRYFPESAFWTAPLGVLTLVFGTHLLALAQRPMIWELPIVGGVAFSLLAVSAGYWAMHGRRPVLAMALAGLSLGLAVGSRPTCLLAAPLLLAPLVWAWREQGTRGIPWRLVLAAVVPLGLCGLALMAHNAARFGSPFEFGQNYQLSGAYESKLTHFSLRFLTHNFSVYFFQLLKWTAEFPFAFAHGVQINHIPDYFGTEEVSGLAVTYPILWCVLALPFAGWRRDPAEARRLWAALGTIAGYTVPVMILILCYFSTCARYQTDFAVGFGVLALVGLLAVERRVQRLAWRRVLSPVLVAAGMVTIGMGILLSFDYHGRSLQKNSPTTWQRLDRTTHGVIAGAAHWLGWVEGPRVLKVRFKAQPTGTIETFWQPEDARVGERVLVEHIGEQLIRFGYRREETPVVWGRPLRWEQNHTHTVSVQVPSLYDPAPPSGWRALNLRYAFRERTAVAVWFSGGRALGLVTEPLSPGVAPGGKVGTDFTGEVRRVTSRLFRPDEIEAGGLVEPHAKRGGVLQMRVVLPSPLQEAGEPLFAGGAHYRSSIVFVRPAPGGVKFVYENYGGATVESDLITPSASGHFVELELPTFRPHAFGEEHTGDVVVRVDGREVLRTHQVAYPFAWGDEAIGWNPFGTTCALAFRGWILDARWNGAGN